MNKLGYIQKEILRRIKNAPGQSTYALLNGLDHSNQPEKRLEEKGLIVSKPELTDGGNVRRHKWYLTEDGITEVKERNL